MTTRPRKPTIEAVDALFLDERESVAPGSGATLVPKLGKVEDKQATPSSVETKQTADDGSDALSQKKSSLPKLQHHDSMDLDNSGITIGKLEAGQPRPSAQTRAEKRALTTLGLGKEGKEGKDGAPPSKADQDDMETPGRHAKVEEYGVPLQLCLECDNEAAGEICNFCGYDQFRIVSSNEVPERLLAHHVPIVIDGFMHKLGGKKRALKWQRRYFALDEKGNLTYHRTDQLHIHQLDEELGRMQVAGAVVTSYDLFYFPERDGYVFGVRPQDTHREYLLETEDYMHRKLWMKALVGLGATQGGHKSAPRCHSQALIEQFAWKKGGIRKNWKRRWFTLLKDPPVITYCKDKRNPSKLLGTISLTKETTIKEGSVTGFEVLVQTDPTARIYILRTVDERQRQQWVLALRAVLDFHSGNKEALANKNFMPVLSPVGAGPSFTFPAASQAESSPGTPSKKEE